jgi:hypothetical protein
MVRVPAKDTFQDLGLDPYGTPMNKALINDSLSRDLETTIKYPKAFYYELPNAEFNAAMKTCFNVTDTPTPIEPRLWEPIAPVLADEAHAIVKDSIAVLLREKADAFKLPDGTAPPLQVVHDRLVQAQIAPVPKPSTSDDAPQLYDYRIKSEFIFYRESKYQGKHVGFVCTVSPDGLVEYLQANVIGVVSADNIGMWPVMPLDGDFVGFAAPDL